MRRKRRRAKRGIHVSTKTGIACKYRSSWEASYLRYLDDSPLVETYAYEPFAIPYVSNSRTGKVRKYYPDFLIKYKTGEVELVEIKPSRKVKQRMNMKKIAAGIAWCAKNSAKFSVVTEVELKVLELL